MSNKNFVRSVISLSLLCAVGELQAAKYEVKELLSDVNYRQSYAMDINNQGDVVGLVRDSFNFPFYLESYITSDNGVLRNCCDFSDEELTTGEFDSFSSGLLKQRLSQTTRVGNHIAYGTSPFFQKIGDFKGFHFNAATESSEVINLFDFVDDELNDYTRSNIEQLRASNSNGIIVGYGTAPFEKISFQQSGEGASEDPITLWQTEFASKAVAIVNGEVISLESDEMTYGGFSAAYDISDSNFVAGVVAESTYDLFTARVNEDCDNELLPFQVCAWDYFKTGSTFNLRPVIWELDNAGNIISKTVYGLAFEPNEDQNGSYPARALAVNDNGVAVGFGQIPYTDSSSTGADFPLLFQNGETTELFPDHQDWDRGYATDINNNNVVVGNLDTYFDRAFNSEFFVYHIDSGKLETPETFYSTAQSTAAGINDAGLVVGRAEYEITTSSTRRKHGFLYNTVTQEFADLNDLIACNSAYEIVDVSSINNQGQIVATALKLVDRKDYLGEVIIDDETGEASKEEVAVAILLDPIPNGEVEECIKEEDEPYKRKGFSFGFIGAGFLSFLVGIRRRFL